MFWFILDLLIIFKLMDSDQFFSYSSPLKLSMADAPSAQDNHDEKSAYQPRQILTSNIKELYGSRDRLREFASKIGHQCNNPIRNDVIQHCNKIKINWNQSLGYEKIQKMTKNRIQKMIKNKRIKKNWSEEDVFIFIWVVSKYSDYKGAANVQRDLNHQDWEDIAGLIPGVEAESCMFKWLGLKKNNLSDNCWSDRESSLLEKIVKKYGDSDWSIIAQKLYYANTSSYKIFRCPKQCRQHWNCYLNPKLKKGPWSKEEDILLLSSVMRNNGQKRWAQIVKDFDGRTQNALKNRYTLIIDKEVKNVNKNSESIEVSEIDIIKEYLQRTYVEQFVNIQNQCESLENNSQSKMKDLKKMRKTQSCMETPKRQVRTSLRRRASAKQKKIPEIPQNRPFMNYCDLIKPKLEVQYSSPFTPETAKSSQKQKNKIFSDENDFIEPKKNPTRRSNRQANRGLKRWKSIPSQLEEIYESESNKIKVEEQYNHAHSYLPIQENNFHLDEIYVKEEIPIYEESEKHSNFDHAFKHMYEDEDFLLHDFNFSESEEKINHLGKEKDHLDKNEEHSLFHSFRQQESHHQNEYYPHESSFNFHSFDHFVIDHDFEFEKPLHNIGTTNQFECKQKQNKPLHETWQQMPCKIQQSLY